jgi:predicted secreted protein
MEVDRSEIALVRKDIKLRKKSVSKLNAELQKSKADVTTLVARFLFELDALSKLQARLNALTNLVSEKAFKVKIARRSRKRATPKPEVIKCMCTHFKERHDRYGCSYGEKDKISGLITSCLCLGFTPME